MRLSRVIVAILLSAPAAIAQQPAQPVALTIYNQNFAVARTLIDLDLHSGVNEVTTTGVTSRVEPDSVILRDPTGKRLVHVIEQNYDAAVVSQEWLLEKYEGKTIDFQVSTPQGIQTVQGKIIRAGFQRQAEYTFDGQQLNGYNAQPLVEVNGKMQFQLPGLPLFPAATDGLLLKPTLRWQIQSDKTDRFTAELAYITGGLDWSATYNVVLPASSDVTGDERADVHGWVTIHNQSGTDFPQARIKLMAGDVAKLRPVNRGYAAQMMAMASAGVVEGQPQVTQKPFDDFHLYDLNRTVALRDGETKQVQFLDAADVTVRRSYLYDGASTRWQQQAYYGGNVNEQRGYGLDEGNTRVYVVEQFKNSDSNHLGVPLPAGRVRLYRRDADGQMEFVGESLINHTPAEETVKVPTGSAFDVKGSRLQTDFHINQQDRLLDETFEIKVTNQKQQPVNVTVVEHLYRGDNWEIRDKSTDYARRDSHTIEFPLEVPAKGDTTLTYSVRYTW
ncbi:MAG: hypothetical protein ABSG51_09290 [Terracidiphilus sp.]